MEGGAGMKTRFRLLVVIALALGATGCDRSVSRMLSHELDGVWITDDPCYQGRSMELSPKFVILIIGSDEPASVQWIDKVRSEPTEDGLAVTVYSTDFPDGNSARMSLWFSQGRMRERSAFRVMSAHGGGCGDREAERECQG
jgi:hypothetical protein